MKFGAMVLANLEVDRTVELARHAEESGFDFFWLNDCDLLYRNPWPILAVIARETQHIKLGLCVTNFVTRPLPFIAGMLDSLEEISHGRMILGVGRGDAAVHILGKRPLAPERFRSSMESLRRLVSGEQIQYESVSIQSKFTAASKVPIWGAGYGPQVLKAIGEVCDGFIVQGADSEIVSWAHSLVEDGARAAGRRMSEVELMVAAPSYVGADLEHGLEQVRWFGATVVRHLAGLVRKYGGQVPDGIARLGGVSSVDADSGVAEMESAEGAFANISDEIVNRVAIVGPADTHIARLRTLSDSGVDNYTVYLNHDALEETVDAYARHVIPALQ